MSITVVIDPGHGGSDRANRGTQGYVEADGVLRIAQHFRAMFSPYARVELTRTDDTTVSLRRRAELARQWDADVFLSFHTNALGPPGTSQTRASGSECWVSRFENGSRPPAERTLQELNASLGTRNRGVKTRESPRYPGQDWFAVIRYLQSYRLDDRGRAIGIDPARSIPAVIVEFAFHDHPEEERMLLDDGNLARAAWAVGRGLIGHYRLGTAIMGEARLAADAMAAFVARVNPGDGLVQELARLYLALGLVEGVRGDVAFAQAIHETGYFRFTGVVRREQNNFCGLGATGPDQPGHSFPNPAVGVLAHLQHLKVYGSPAPATLPLVDPRWDAVVSRGWQGTAPFVELLDHKWAGEGYGRAIGALYRRLAASAS